MDSHLDWSQWGWRQGTGERELADSPRLGFGSPAEKGDPGGVLPGEPGPWETGMRCCLWSLGLALGCSRAVGRSTYCSRMYEDWKMRCHGCQKRD